MTARFLPSGDTALVVEFGERIDRAVNDRVLNLRLLLNSAKLPGVVETVPTLRSLLVRYDPLTTDSASLIAALEGLLNSGGGKAASAKLWRIPACYAHSHAPDLDDVAERTGLDRDEVVRLHSSTRFQIYMIGFVPGFPYMGDLPRALFLPRRTDPRVRVPPGSIAIATGMTSIYPIESPGGWHLIGATPIRLFDLHWPRATLLSPGDLVEFEPIAASEFDAIRAAVAAGTYQLNSEAVAA